MNRAVIHVGGQSQAGKITITRTYTQTSAGTLVIELAGTATEDHDLLDVRSTGAGAVTLAGTLTINLINGFTPALADTFIILDYNNVTDTFTAIIAPGLGGGLSLDVTVDSSETTATVIS